MNRIKRLISMLCASSLLLMGCGTTVAESEVVDERLKIEREENEIILWSYYNGGWDEVVENFNKFYPDIKVTVKCFEYDGEDGYEVPYIKALASGEVPDLMIMDSTDYGSFNSMNGLENLYNYGIEKYEKDFDKEAWEIGKSASGKEMLGVTFASAPRLTYYRADIMKKYGFPDDPEELAKFMEDKDNYLEIARTLKKNNISIIQYDTDPITFTSSSFGCFDRELNLIKNTEELRESIEISKIAKDEKLPTYNSVWDPPGLQDLKAGRLAMLYLGSWGADQIAQWVPEQSGLWRVTRLPFNVYGWNNSSIISLTEESPNKDLAMKFLEFFCFTYKSDEAIGSVSSYNLSRRNENSMKYENEFLGGQREQEYYEALMDKTSKHVVTPLDKAGNKIVDDCINIGLWEKTSVDGIFRQIEEKIERELGEKKKIILETQR